jgi:glycerophosphoryl diester phosphodiesterase
VRVFAHRGSHRSLPENTHAAFARAIEEGADGVELDVRTCASGEVVVVHDADLERLAGDPMEVARVPYGRLARADLGGGERVPGLDAVLDQALGAGLEVNVEVKGDVPDRRGTARAVAALLERRRANERAAVILSSFDPLVLAALRARARGVRTALLFDAEHTGLRRTALLLRALWPQGVHPHYSLCTERAVRGWKARGLFVGAWTVNEPTLGPVLERAGLDLLITDEVPAMREALKVR